MEAGPPFNVKCEDPCILCGDRSDSVNSLNQVCSRIFPCGFTGKKIWSDFEIEIILKLMGLNTMSKFYQLSAVANNGEEIRFEDFHGNVVLVVNTASKCGFTPQYEGLQKLYENYRDRGFVILAFPCNQFARQEPGNDDEIRNFCSLNYGVTFPLFQKVDVNGSGAHPVFQYLTERTPGWFGKKIKWNFTKFLVDRNGENIYRFAPYTPPEKIESMIEDLLENRS